MATTKTRLRKLERDRYERKLVKRAQQQRRSRRVRSGFGAFLTLAVLGLGTAWLLDVFEPGAEDPQAQDFDRCFWQEQEGDPDRVDVGLPDANPPDEGTSTVTVDLAAGDAGSGQLVVEMDVAADPCGAGNLAHLAGAGFFDDTVCHELTDEGALRCGDPSGTGLGGPSYAFFAENYPVGDFDLDSEGQPQAGEDEVLYPAGTVAWADVTGTHGSQFLIFYEDFAPETPIWPILGTVSSGLDLVSAVGAAGVDGEETPGPPAQEVRVVSLTVEGPDAGAGDGDES